LKNFKLIIQYDGTDYAGWQIQNNALTVQQVIKEKLQVILRTDEINLIGAGRTDAGVHALGQVANFNFEEILNLKKIKHSLNSILPKNISIISIETVKNDFHARFSAKKRSYFYLFNSVKSPFYERYSWFDSRFSGLYIAHLNQIANVLIGTHDFTSFSKRNSEVENKNCEVFSLRWYRKDNITFLFIEADRFLHGMVRALTGTLLKSIKQKNPEKYLQDILEAKDRTAAGESVPAKGLFLFKVKY
jgi:tRNA pseudouridine38-40 synthase